MSRKILLPVIILFLSFTTSYCQSKKSPSGTSLPANKKEVLLAKTRTLLVGLYGDPKTDEKITSLVKNIWGFNENIVIVDQEMIPDKIKGKENDFAILTINLIKIKSNTIGGSSSEYIRFSIKLGEKYNKVNPLYFQDSFFTVEGGKMNLDIREIIVALNVIQKHLEDRAAGISVLRLGLQGAGMLEKKTLLLDKDFLDKETSIEMIRLHYPYPFKISSKNEIEKALLNRDSRYAFVEILPAGTSFNMMTQNIYNCEDFVILGMGELNNGAFDNYSNLINEDHLKAFVKSAQRMIKYAEKFD